MLDPRIAMGVQPIQIEPQANALMRALQITNAMQQNRLAAMQGQDMAEQRRMQREQMQNALMDRERQRQAVAAIPSPRMTAAQNALISGGGPTVENAQRMAPVDPRAEVLHQMLQGGLVSPADWYKQMYPEAKFSAAAPGSTVFDERTGAQKFTAPEKAPAKPAAVQEFEYGQQNPAFTAWDQARRRAGATSVRVDAAPKAFWQDVGKLQADALFKDREGAQAASQTLQAVGQIRQAAAGGAYQGFGAEAKLGAAKALGALGMPYDAKTVANSELFDAQAKQFVLAQIKGLGANPSNTDREFIEKTVPRLGTDPAALPLLLDFMERKAQAQIRSFNQRARQVQQDPNAAGLPIGLEVQEPTSSDGWGIKPLGGK